MARDGGRWGRGVGVAGEGGWSDAITESIVDAGGGGRGGVARCEGVGVLDGGDYAHRLSRRD